ncbi:MAG: thymidylate kinase [Ruminococcaceae bacterium]|nr:thymidylate kinase [Oscillospiraceae bacterium]
MENKKGRIIVIEGLDGSGKNTQARLLAEKLSENYELRRLSYPDYDSPSSALVKMYLGGELGDDPMDVNAYAASAFYAVDRIASFLKHWKNDYNNGMNFIFDRYSTSNAVYMLSKLSDSEKEGYLKWLEDFEFGKMGLPAPDKVIYLDMPTEISQRLMSERYKGDESKKDLHEKNVNFLKLCRENALFAAEKLGWTVIECSDGENPYTIDEIAGKVLEEALKVF